MKANRMGIVAVLGIVILIVVLGCRSGSDRSPASTQTVTMEPHLQAERRLPQGLKEVASAAYPSVEGLASGSEQAQERQRAAVKELGLPLEVDCEMTGMRFRLIPAGEFVMGSPSNEADRNIDEGPQRTVKLTKPFYMGVTDVTQAQYQRVMGSKPSEWKGDNLPVEQVSWNDATEFCRRMSQLTGLTITLPTEAQWEYACRAGTTTPYYFGSNANQLGDYAWFTSNSGSKTHPVGTKKPNAWGLYDMHGNVWEWCQDWFQDSYNGLAKSDPQGPQSGADRVLRGGGWSYDALNCRSAARGRDAPDYTYGGYGVRVVLVSGGLDF